MASPNPSRAELLALTFSENFLPTSEEQRARQPSTFLSLAPTTSASYPSTPLVKIPAIQSPKQAAALPAQTADNTRAETTGVTPAVPDVEEIDMEVLKTRRSSSLGSDGSSKKRFLKLGPVHFGEGDGNGDWSEDVVAE
jgi:hypothetical protein